MKTALLVVLLWSAACMRVDHVPPAARSISDAVRSVVLVEVTCAEGEAWSRSGHATGVIVSERHVLTAAHVTACPEIPTVYVTFRGVRWRAVVELEDTDGDLARLELATAETFHLTDIPPPILGDVRDGDAFAYLWPRYSSARGHGLTGSRWVYDMRTRPGDSGAPVYNAAGELVGLVRAGDGANTQLAPVSARMLEGL